MYGYSTPLLHEPNDTNHMAPLRTDRDDKGFTVPALNFGKYEAADVDPAGWAKLVGAARAASVGPSSDDVIDLEAMADEDEEVSGMVDDSD